jgi:hypothetical protein
VGGGGSGEMATAAVGNAPRTAAARSSVWTRGELAWAEASEGGGVKKTGRRGGQLLLKRR